jgi:hypothetical protein
MTMGFNTVLVVLNDHLDVGAKDPTLGEKIQRSSLVWPRVRRGVESSFFAQSGNCSASYGEVISCDHANGHQVVIVHGNTGWRLDDPALPEECLKALERQLKQVKRERKPAGGEG